MRRAARDRFAGLAPAALLALLALAPWRAGLAGSSEPYRTAGDCDGYPAVELAVRAPLCVGLVAQGLGFARGVAALGSDIFVLDMGGWGSHRGRLLRLAEGGRAPPRVLLGGLFQPNALLPGPAHTLYVGETGRIVQIDPYAGEPARTQRVVLSGLPTSGRHPLPALAQAPDGALYINVGSATDNCERAGGARPDPRLPCPETQEQPPRGAILRLPRGAASADAHTLAPYARGLRNAAALAILPDGTLAAAVNARDAISRVDPGLADAQLPHDTLERIEADADYGWPYCFDAGRASPEYPDFDCRSKRAPALLLPAHAAPLGMLAYRGARLPGLHGKLVIAYHGYRAAGHRIVAVDLDGQTRPTGEPLELVSDWQRVTGSHPQGAPVALFELDDGSILISEDHNGTLLRLSTQRVR